MEKATSQEGNEASGGETHPYVAEKAVNAGQGKEQMDL
jgi:hypothetical protein